jgi:hypothetical protein
MRSFGIVMLGALLLTACNSGGGGPSVGGQSGSEGGSIAPGSNCVCVAASQGKAPLRATLLAHEGHEVRVRVDEVLSNDVVPELMVGMEVGGLWRPTMPCGDGLAPVPGDSLLVFFQRGNQDNVGCREYQSCSTGRCGPAPEDGTLDDFARWDECDSVCLEETRTQCATHAQDAWLHGRVELALWEGDEWFFAQGDKTIKAGTDELSVLRDDNACGMRFPVEPEPTSGDGMMSDAPSPPSSGEGAGGAEI